MAGELWNGKIQIGKEATPGTAVAATRIMYTRDPVLSPNTITRGYKFATGTRDNRRAHTTGPQQPGGKFGMPLSADEMIEWLLMSVQGGVTPSTPSGATLARLWDFRPGSSVPDAATVEWHDGARPWREVGAHINQLTIAGTEQGENLVTSDLFGRSFAQNALTGALAERSPTFVEGWETALYLDAFGVAPGTTRMSGLLLGWQVQFANALARKYFADNTKQARGIAIGEIDATAQLTFEGAPSQALTEFANYEAPVKRVMRLVFGQNSQLESAPTNEIQTVAVVGGSPSGGTFTLTYEGVVSGAIAWNATAAAVQAILEAMPNIGTGNVSCTGGALPTAVNVTFLGALSGLNVVQFALGTNSVTPSGTPTFATPTPGVGYKRAVIIDLPGAWMAVDLGQTDGPTRAYRFNYEYEYDPTNAFGLRVQCYNARTVAYA
jgi:hypothetical protein